jgi:hypothetical protein
MEEKIEKIEEKVCTECGVSKTLDKFGVRNYTNYSTRRSDCKQCNCEYSRKRRIEKKDQIRESNNLYNQKNREKVRDLNNANYAKYRKDPLKRIIYSNRSRISKMLKEKSLDKTNSTVGFIGCALSFLREWLEYQFNSKMNWDNYGSIWHIDHVYPCNKFNGSNNHCFHWTNLRPLEASKNMSKGDKIIPFELVKQEIKVNYYKKLKNII